MSSIITLVPTTTVDASTPFVQPLTSALETEGLTEVIFEIRVTAYSLGGGTNESVSVNLNGAVENLDEAYGKMAELLNLKSAAQEAKMVGVYPVYVGPGGGATAPQATPDASTWYIWQASAVLLPYLRVDVTPSASVTGSVTLSVRALVR